MVDPQECRENAARCIELANESIDQKIQDISYDLALAWLKLASELERRQRIRPASVGQPMPALN